MSLSGSESYNHTSSLCLPLPSIEPSLIHRAASAASSKVTLLRHPSWTFVVSGLFTVALVVCTSQLLFSRNRRYKLASMMAGLGERFSSALKLSSSSSSSVQKLPVSSSPEYKHRYERALQLGGFPGGLSNDGNTCFMNSVLQSIASSKDMMQFLAEFTAKDGAAPTPFSDTLLELLECLNAAHGNRTPTYRTKRLMKVMRNGPNRNMFTGYNQEDAQEFYQNLMKQVEKEYKRESEESSKEKKNAPAHTKFVDRAEGMTMGLSDLGALGDIYVPAQQVDPDFPNVESKVYPLRLVTPVDGLMCERIGCTQCGEIGGIRYSVTSGLDLTLPSISRPEYHLEELLDDWNSPETIEGVECNRCGLRNMRQGLEEKLVKFERTNQDGRMDKLVRLTAQRIAQIGEVLAKPIINDDDYDRLHTKNMVRKSTKIKQAYYSRPPALLCIHVNRSVFDPRTYTVRKNNSKIVFPLELNLAKWVAPPDDINMDARRPFRKVEESEKQCEADPRLKYVLKSVISHFGTHNYGHYICYRWFRQNWWRISDEIVRLSSEREVLDTQGTFMLFYELASEQDEVVKEEVESIEEKVGDSKVINTNVENSSDEGESDTEMIEIVTEAPNEVPKEVKENSKEDSKEDLKEDSKEDSKENSTEDSKENLKEDLKEDSTQDKTPSPSNPPLSSGI